MKTVESDEEDFVFYGTPIQREEDVTSRKKKSVAEAAGQLRAVVPWKQEVRDEEGRRRFHGAFTGGYSAGYFNTVGSKEGWVPQTFTSSRKKRAEVKQQDISNFLDDDEKEEMKNRSLETSMQFDTFGSTAAEIARRQAEKEQENRPSAIPGLVPDEIILPVSSSIGVKLLQKMGWRHGRSIKDSRPNSLYDARREARKALLAYSSGDADAKLSQDQFDSDKVESEGVTEPSSDNDVFTSHSTPVFVLNPKQDMYGLGFDPFKHAPEFREQKRLRVYGNQEPGNKRGSSMKEHFLAKSGKVAPGFGIGALEELDDEDEDVYGSGYNFQATHVQEIEEPSVLMLEDKKKPGKTEQGVLAGFKSASTSDYQSERYSPPVIPDGFKPYHKFLAPLEIGNKHSGPPPPEVPPPEENNLRVLIEGFSTLVARCGRLFEDLSKEKNKQNHMFAFLDGGKGHDYYARKLWEEQQKRHDETKQPVDIKSNVEKMTAEGRGRILGERPSERSSQDSSSSVVADAVQLQFNLSDTFMKPGSISELPEAAKPFNVDPEKQKRFERFLKEKYHGGLRTTESGGSSKMSEADRAREKLDFEAAAEAIQKAGPSKSADTFSSQQFWASLNTQFTSAGVEDAKISQAEEEMRQKLYPRREEYQWRPSSLLCKRFEITDPYIGKPPPLPRAKSRIDSLIFTSDVMKPTKSEEAAIATTGSLSASQSKEPLITEQLNVEETAVDLKPAYVERPVDLYKGIFSDDSDDEGEGSTINQVEDIEKKTEVANTTLNRLIAGDFLESLGKELGLEVPQEPAVTTVNKVSNLASQRGTNSISGIDVKLAAVDEKPSTPQITFSKPIRDQEAAKSKSVRPEVIQGGSSEGNELKQITPGDFEKSKILSTRDRSGKSPEGEKSKRGSRHHRNYSSSSASSDEDEMSRRKRSRRHRSMSDSDSGDREYRKRSRKSEKRSSSHRKSSSSSSKKHKSSRRGSGRDEYSEDRKRSRKI
ncbi:hypothetical protein MKW98_017308 [Papaver atlanticum]|uniref:SURP motif domain-containing protein n=1 Tax=Papaver atlanticum TaxID=357466 RepID=A0AAD4SQI1_9MAGN|nr:hypothetical protein MKW98_017308 [Papaver atlanticum]